MHILNYLLEKIRYHHVFLTIISPRFLRGFKKLDILLSTTRFTILRNKCKILVFQNLDKNNGFFSMLPLGNLLNNHAVEAKNLLVFLWKQLSNERNCLVFFQWKSTIELQNIFILRDNAPLLREITLLWKSVRLPMSAVCPVSGYLVPT